LLASLPLYTAALKSFVFLPAELPLPTGAIHVPPGASSPTRNSEPGCIVTHTCTPPLWDAPRVVSGTRIVEPRATCTFW